MFARLVSILVFVMFLEVVKCTLNCRDSRISHLTIYGDSCFEIPPWQNQPVEVTKHLNKIRDVWGSRFSERRQTRLPELTLNNRDVKRYMDTVISPFLDTYHSNIQNSYQQMMNKILKEIKDEINVALRKKQTIYTELTELADSLKVPPMCSEERRASRSLASKHVAHIYKCTEQARTSVAEMGKYAEGMITITRNHMEFASIKVAKNLTTYEEIHHAKTSGLVGGCGRGWLPPYWQNRAAKRLSVPVRCRVETDKGYGFKKLPYSFQVNAPPP